MRPLLIIACLATVLGSLDWIPAVKAAGKVIPPRFEELVECSERIVLAKVEWEHNGLAHATVKEVWKGPKVETVEYLVSPKSAHDHSQAVPGENVLLFLNKQEGIWRIALLGHGRKTLETQDSKEYVSFFPKEIPDGVASVAFSGGKKDRVDRGVELKLIKELVDKAIESSNK